MLHKDGTAFGLCLRFAAKPGSVMFTEDISKKWGVHPKQVGVRLRPAREAGWVERLTSGKETYYVAGPALRALMEEP